MDKKEQILNAAFMLFSEKGYNFSMSDLAKAVKLKTPSLYSHFESKDQIVELTVKTEIEHYFSYLNSTINSHQGKSCKEKIEVMFFSVINYFYQSGRLRFWRSIPLLIDDELRNKCRITILEKDRFYNRYLKKCFEEGIVNGEIKESVDDGSIYLYHSMLQGLLDGMLLSQNSNLDISEYANSTWIAFWNGIKTETKVQYEK